MTWLRYACSSAWWGWIAHPSDIFQAHNVRHISHQPWQIPAAMLPRKPWQTMANQPSWMCLWILLRMTSGLSTTTCEHTIVTIKSWGRFNMASPPTSTNHRHQPLQHPESNSETLYGLVSSGSVLSNSGPRGVKDAPTTGVYNHSGGLFHGIRLGMFHGIISPTILRNIKGVTLLFIHNLS